VPKIIGKLYRIERHLRKKSILRKFRKRRKKSALRSMRESQRFLYRKSVAQYLSVLSNTWAALFEMQKEGVYPAPVISTRAASGPLHLVARMVSYMMHCPDARRGTNSIQDQA
jgi:hypothetical protein